MPSATEQMGLFDEETGKPTELLLDWLRWARENFRSESYALTGLDFVGEVILELFDQGVPAEADTPEKKKAWLYTRVRTKASNQRKNHDNSKRNREASESLMVLGGIPPKVVGRTESRKLLDEFEALIDESHPDLIALVENILLRKSREDLMNVLKMSDIEVTRLLAKLTRIAKEFFDAWRAKSNPGSK
jgi:hypothetical protein